MFKNAGSLRPLRRHKEHNVLKIRRALCAFFVDFVTLSIYIEASEGSFLREPDLVKALSSEIQRERLKRAAF
jgi:hypothetical protein